MLNLSNTIPTVVVLFLSMLSCCADALAQVHTASDGIVRIETRTGSGSGFIVCSGQGRIEAWTNGHVTGRVGTSVLIRINTGTASERLVTGTVVDRQYAGGSDWAKVVATAEYNGHVFPIASCFGCNLDRITGGFPNGGRFKSLVLSPTPAVSFGDIEAYLPASIPGQSGSPVCNSKGEVVGVVTLYFEDGRSRYGGYLPISDWTGNARVSSRNTGNFKTLDNSPPVD